MNHQRQCRVTRICLPKRASALAGFVTLSILFSSTVAFAQTTVTLNTSARVKADAALKLSDVAIVAGDDAKAIGGISLFENAAAQCKGGNSWFDLSVADVRTALDSSGANLGRTTLRGSTCVVRFGGAGGMGGAAGSKDVQTPLAKKRTSGLNEPTTVNVSEPSTIRTIIALTLARFLGVNADSVKLGFDPKDESLLLRPTAGKRVDVQPAAATTNELMPVRVYTYSGDQLLSSDTISIKVVVRRTVLTAAQAIERKGTIEASMLTTGQAWVSPNATITCTMEQALGAMARNKIPAGQPIVAKLIDTPLLIHRGDTVEIHCLSGSVTLKASRARALGAGREGEYVAFQLVGSKKTFTARVSGRGRAIIVVGEVATPQTDKQAEGADDKVE